MPIQLSSGIKSAIGLFVVGGIGVFCVLLCANFFDRKKLEASPETEEICSGVPDTWYSSTWHETSREVCLDQWALFQDGYRPCSFGGMPFMCLQDDVGVAVTRFGMIGVEIHKTDLERVRGHLFLY